MNLQKIKSIAGNDEYVLLPIAIYDQLKPAINKYLDQYDIDDYVQFDPADYVKNPIALARIKANLTQENLAVKMGVTQEYVSKIENKTSISAKLAAKVKQALENEPDSGEDKKG